MPVNIIAESAAKPRSAGGGSKLSGLPEWQEANAALSKMAAGQAIEIKLDAKTASELSSKRKNKKGKEVTRSAARYLANAFKSRFKRQGLQFIAYASGSDTVTIRKGHPQMRKSK